MKRSAIKEVRLEVVSCFWNNGMKRRREAVKEDKIRSSTPYERKDRSKGIMFVEEQDFVTYSVVHILSLPRNVIVFL